MADFEYAFASAGTPVSFPVNDSGITGIDEIRRFWFVSLEAASRFRVRRAAAILLAKTKIGKRTMAEANVAREILGNVVVPAEVA